MPVLLAVLIALALTAPADASNRPHARTVCVPTYEPGVGPGSFCATRFHRR